MCADVLIEGTLIEGALIEGISGGQAKRTSVGIEIITSPTLLFLDEPPLVWTLLGLQSCGYFVEDCGEKVPTIRHHTL